MLKTLLFWDNLCKPIYTISFFLLARKSKTKTSNQSVVIKFFGIGSIVRTVYFLDRFSDKKILFITFDSNRELLALLGIEGFFIRKGVFGIWDLFRIIVKVWNMRSTEIIDFERSSNIVGVLRMILGVNKPCTSFYFAGQNDAYKNQKRITLSGKRQLTAMEELFAKKCTEQETIKRSNQSKTIVINVNTGDYISQRKYPLEQFAQVAKMIKKRDDSFEIVITGAPNEVQYTLRFSRLLNELQVAHKNLSGQLSLTEFVELLKSSCLVITGDSGPLHLAKYFSVPTVGIWGPTSAEQVAYPESALLKNVSLNMPCSPCFIHPKSPLAQACDNAVNCLKDLTANQAYAAASHFLTHEKPANLAN